MILVTASKENVEHGPVCATHNQIDVTPRVEQFMAAATEGLACCFLFIRPDRKWIWFMISRISILTITDSKGQPVHNGRWVKK